MHGVSQFGNKFMVLPELPLQMDHIFRLGFIGKKLKPSTKEMVRGLTKHCNVTRLFKLQPHTYSKSSTQYRHNTYVCSENKGKTQHEREKKDKEMSTQQVNKTKRQERKMAKAYIMKIRKP